MSTFEHLSIAAALEKIATDQLLVVDIRDQVSYENSHIDGAIHISEDNLEDFLLEADLNRPVLVYCYHGYSSQAAAQLLIERGFEEGYSLIGGYSAWESYQKGLSK